MTKLIKKPVSVILSLLMIIGLLTAVPLTVNAAYIFGDYKITTSGQNCTIIQYTGTAETVVIPSKISNYTVTALGNGDASQFVFNNNRRTMTSITLPDTLTKIDAWAFYGCNQLQSITIPESVTTIGNYAFYSCSSLSDVTVLNERASFGSSVFSGCSSSLTIRGYSGSTANTYATRNKHPFVVIPNGQSEYEYTVNNNSATITKYNGTDTVITIPNQIDGYTVSAIGDNAFKDNTSLTVVTIPNGVTSIGSAAFRGCSNLQSVSIPSSVNSILSSAFYNCTNLTGVTIPNGVTRIENYCFYSCSSLTSLIIPSGVTSINYQAFYGCRGLQSISIPSTVNYIASDSFYNCRGLMGITIPNGITSIESETFRNCSGLTSITIPDSVTNIGSNAFQGCTSLTNLTIGNNVTTIGDYAFNNCRFSELTIPDSVQTIGQFAFQSCSFSEVIIPESVIRINDNSFRNNSNLSSVTILNAEATIGFGVFAYCNSNLVIYGYGGSTADTYASSNSITFVDLAGGNGSSDYEYTVDENDLATVTMYKGSDTAVEVPERLDNNYVISIGNEAFKDNTTLTSVTLPDGITTIGGQAFAGCTSLTSVTFGSGITTIGNSAFSGTGITNITIPNSVTTIGDSAFYGCTGLTTVSMPNNVSVGNSAFYGCTGLTSATIPNNAISIADGMFGECTNLTTVVIPDSVTTIGDGAFSDCSGLTSVTIPRSVTSITNSFEGCSNLTICGYDGSIASYYASENNIPFSLMVKTNTGDGYIDAPLTDTQSKDAGDNSFSLSQSVYNNIELLGVQKKTSEETNDMRFVAVINEGLIKDAAQGGDIADYGFVLAKTSYKNTAAAKEKFISKVKTGLSNTLTYSCKNTDNSFSGNYGKKAADTKYKYMTLVINNVPEDQGFVVRFFVKTKSGKVYYANYKSEYTGCVTSYANLSALIS